MTHYRSLTLAGLGLAALTLTACQDQAEAPVSAAEATPAPAAVATAPNTDTALSESDRLNAWFDEQYEALLQRSPTQLTILGRKDRYDELDDFGEAALRADIAWRQATVEEMRANFEYDALTPQAKESWDLWVYQTERAEAGLEFMYNNYLFSELGGPEALLPTFMINFHRVDTESDARAYISRLQAAGRALGQTLEMAQRAAEYGVRPPRFAFEVAQERAAKVVSGLPFSGEADSPLFADINRKIGSLEESGLIDAATAGALRAEAETALLESIGPAYQEYIAWLELEAPNADAEPQGVAAQPNGEAFYDHQLANYTTLPLSYEDVHALGIVEVERIKGEMEAIKDQVGFEGSLQDFFAFVRTDEQFYYPNTDEGREAYLEDTRAFLADIDAKLPEFFGRLPRAELEVRRVEAFREVDGGAQHYMPGTPDGSRKGVYYVHMSDMSSYSKTDMETVAYHEASPGHHMQISIAQELEGIPQFRTRAGFSVYSEGWALYSEKLAKEMGQFTNPYMDFGRLTAEMWRAIRLVVDTGLHAKGWSQEQAVAYFLENSAIPEGAVRSEVRRYLTIPGQATSYKIGMIKIEELRARAEEILGEGFDIRGFHDVVLGGGALPLPLLEARVDRWIAEQQG